MKLYLVNGTSIITEPFDTEYLLQTFFELRNSKRIEKEVVEFIEKNGQDNFILDSGAFSLFNGKKLTYDGLKVYIDKYCDFINKWDIKQFVEMDIDAVIGYEESKKINKYIESRVGKKPMYVHHIESRTKEDLMRACDESDYLMWGGIAGKGKSVEVINTFVDFCYDYNKTKVHALGFTPLDLDMCKNLYSCDSSSWTMGGRAGNIFQFTNNKMDTFKLDDKKRITFYELNNHNMRQWVKYQTYLKTKGWIV